MRLGAGAPRARRSPTSPGRSASRPLADSRAGSLDHHTHQRFARPDQVQAELRGKANLDVLISSALHATPAWLVTCAINGTRPDVGEGPTFEPVMSDNGKITLWRTVQTQRGTGPHGKPWFISHDEAATSKGDARDNGLFCNLQ
jgi:hypothetical protein